MYTKLIYFFALNYVLPKKVEQLRQTGEKINKIKEISAKSKNTYLFKYKNNISKFSQWTK